MEQSRGLSETPGSDSSSEESGPVIGGFATKKAEEAANNLPSIAREDIERRINEGETITYNDVRHYQRVLALASLIGVLDKGDGNERRE